MKLPQPCPSCKAPIMNYAMRCRCGYEPAATPVVERLVEAAISVCEPENADEAASAHTRQVLRKRFEDILTSSELQKKYAAHRQAI